MTSSSLLRCLVICVVLGMVVETTKLLESKLLQKNARFSLEKLKKELVEEKKRVTAAGIKNTDDTDAKKEPAAAEDKVVELAEESVSNEETVNTKVDSDNSQSDKPTDENKGDDSLIVEDAFDAIFYYASVLSDELKTNCDIDLEAIYKGYSPATLKGANDARTSLLSATQALSDKLTTAPGFAEDLEEFVDSAEYDDSKVASNIDKTLKNIETTLSTVHKQLFCAEGQVIAARLQMSLYGGQGFANGYLCNKVFVELARLDLNATKVMKALSTDPGFTKQCVKNLADDITCYEKELEAFNKVIPNTPFTEQSPLQLAAFTSDFMINYGVLLIYHHLVLEIEGEIVKACASDDDDDDDDDDEDNEVDRQGEKSADKDESLTDQLQKLLKKLNEVSEKKKSAEEALNQRSGSKSAVPTVDQKIALKDSFYKRRNNA